MKKSIEIIVIEEEIKWCRKQKPEDGSLALVQKKSFIEGLKQAKSLISKVEPTSMEVIDSLREENKKLKERLKKYYKIGDSKNELHEGKMKSNIRNDKLKQRPNVSPPPQPKEFQFQGYGNCSDCFWGMKGERGCNVARDSKECNINRKPK